MARKAKRSVIIGILPALSHNRLVGVSDSTAVAQRCALKTQYYETKNKNIEKIVGNDIKLWAHTVTARSKFGVVFASSLTTR